MGVVYETKDKKWQIEAREKSIRFISECYDSEFKLNYEELDSFENAVKKAQQIRRDTPTEFEVNEKVRISYGKRGFPATIIEKVFDKKNCYRVKLDNLIECVYHKSYIRKLSV